MEGLILNIQKFSLHDGAGIRTNVFFQGCNLGCEWCCNPESRAIGERERSGARYYGIDELMAELLKDKPFYDMSGGGVTLTGGEALLQQEFVSALIDELRNAGVHTAIETAANVGAELFKTALKCDTVHIDLKHYDDEAHKRGTKTGLSRVLENIRAAVASGVHTVIRIPLIPGYNNSKRDIQGFTELLVELGVREAQIMPFHQLGESKHIPGEYPYAGVPQLHEEDCEPLAAALSEAGIEVQIGG